MKKINLLQTFICRIRLPAAQSKVPAVFVEYFPGGLGVPAKQSLLEVDPIEFEVTPLEEQ